MGGLLGGANGASRDSTASPALAASLNPAAKLIELRDSLALDSAQVAKLETVRDTLAARYQRFRTELRGKVQKLGNNPDPALIFSTIRPDLARFGIVALFLVGFYRVLGVIAAVALAVYALYFYALIKLIPVTLTLPGIAGLILTIGVAADANIVIFERVKEEVRAGRSIPVAIAAGYRKGFSTIVDANVVTLLVAFTGVKDPDYPDTLYVDSLIGPDTVNTMPPKTMDAFRDHGTVAQTLTADLDEARHVLAEAERLGLDLEGVTRNLVTAGVKSFSDAADDLLGAVGTKRAAILGDRLNGMSAALPASLGEKVDARLKTAATEGWTRRLWAGDATLWTGGEEGKWLGWLPAARGEQVDVEALAAFAKDAARFPDAVLIGMGGSSLGPEVLGAMFGGTTDGPTLHVLDTTDPEQIRGVADAIDPKNTLFIVSSKSGSTMEPELVRAFFWQTSGKAGNHFAAVTDPGSKLEDAAKEHGYGHLFHGDPAIGGRYSVLSNFGMVPAAAIGLDVPAFFERTRPMVLACGPDAPPAANPGVQLGVILGEAAMAGRDKLTIVPSPGLAPIAAWLEQLIAESTGKQGKGIVPVAGEPLGDPAAYGPDRLFVHLHLAGDADDGMHGKLDALEQAGQPVVRLSVADRMLIGQEFVRWEVATAIAGAVIGIDPFDQPDVEDAKVATRRLVDAYEADGTLDEGMPTAQTPDFVVFTGGRSTFASADPVEILRAHLSGLAAPQYFGVLAYLDRDAENEATVTAMRTAVRGTAGVATVAGFGRAFSIRPARPTRAGRRPATSWWSRARRGPTWRSPATVRSSAPCNSPRRSATSTCSASGDSGCCASTCSMAAGGWTR